jgi:hypothetical protein
MPETIIRLRQRAYRAYQAGRVRLEQGPWYQARSYFSNRGARQRYREAGAAMDPTPGEQRVLDGLTRSGIAMVPVADLVGPALAEQARAAAEGYLAQPGVQDRIRRISAGERPDDAKGGKFYIVRPLGDVPKLPLSDPLMRITLSDAVLRIVSRYLGMFPRLTAIDLWYNLPTSGPEVYSQRWHRDPEDRRIVKTFLYLHDVDETTGPFCFVPGSHNAGPDGKVYPQLVFAPTYPPGSNYPPDGYVEEHFPAERRMVCTGPPGTMVFCDTTGFHKGGHATGRPRFLFNAVYTTNASAAVRQHQYALLGGRVAGLSPAAEHALGHLGGRVIETP